jgi:hypothetical protein
MILQRYGLIWLPNGIHPKTKTSDPLIARFRLGEGSGGAARKAMNGSRL